MQLELECRCGNKVPVMAADACRSIACPKCGVVFLAIPGFYYPDGLLARFHYIGADRPSVTEASNANP